MPGLRSPVLLGEVLASPGSKLSQPRSENILRTLTSVFSPKCSFSIWGRKILTKSTYMQENHFPSQLVILDLPGIRKSPRSAAEHFRKTRRVKPAVCCGRRQKFPLPFCLYLNFWTFFTYHKDVCTSQYANFVNFSSAIIKNKQTLLFQPKKAELYPVAQIRTGTVFYKLRWRIETKVQKFQIVLFLHYELRSETWFCNQRITEKTTQQFI